MTRDEVKQILMVMQTAYPNYKPENKTVAIDLWAAMLGGYSYQEVLIALESYIATDTKGFAPVIGQIIEKLQTITTPGHMNPMEAWAMVMDAIRDGIYHSKERFDNLPDEVQRAIGSADQIHYWAMDEEFNESVIMSNFKSAYKTVCDRADEHARLPEAARNLIEDTGNRLEG